MHARMPTQIHGRTPVHTHAHTNTHARARARARARAHTHTQTDGRTDACTNARMYTPLRAVMHVHGRMHAFVLQVSATAAKPRTQPDVLPRVAVLVSRPPLGHA